MTLPYIKHNWKEFRSYYESLEQLHLIQATNEMAVRSPFQRLLEDICHKYKWYFVAEHSTAKGKRPDGTVFRASKLVQGHWEAKDLKDNLDREIQKKFKLGYPKDNILFQTPERIVLWQNGEPVFDEDVSDPRNLERVLRLFFEHTPKVAGQWEQAMERFRDEVPEIAKDLQKAIARESKKNAKFVKAFGGFEELCRRSINPNLRREAVEEMLIQHILTERIFRRVFDSTDFTNRNAIAVELEKVIGALASGHFSRHEALKSLDPFYLAIEDTARSISEYGDKQAFLNDVYERFFQGFSVEVADTHGIVYTPQPIVDFMVESVEDLLNTQFGTSLSRPGVRVVDPFVGTGNFMLNVLRKIRTSDLPHKYREDLFCNEVMLLPYYIAALNIEHAYYERTKKYEPFEGLCLVDTFELSQGGQVQMELAFTEKNTERVARQEAAPIFVVIGNPPYNASQQNENDNNKNRKYPEMDRRVAETYARDSAATNKNALSDPYVKAIRWASDRIGKEGIVAFVTNNSFVDGFAFDGMRKHLEKDFTAIYCLDLGGNSRKDTGDGNVFGIRVGVCVSFLVKKPRSKKPCELHYAQAAPFTDRAAKLAFLEKTGSIARIKWKRVKSDTQTNWLTEGLRPEFEGFLSMGDKESKRSKGEAETIFKTYGGGVKTNRDAWCYNFNRQELARNMETTIDFYNGHVDRLARSQPEDGNVDEFVEYEETKISWSESLKGNVRRNEHVMFSDSNIRKSLYRPFTVSNLYFDRRFNERVYQFPSIFPTPETEAENRVICVSGAGHDVFRCLISNAIVELKYSNSANGGTQCFPFYIYNEDGTGRRENITDWSLAQFRSHYKNKRITKWNVFHYCYAVLHHPEYRKRYASNLKKELPRIPFAPDFQAFAKAGKRLAALHLDYENAKPYRLERIEAEGQPLDYRVEKMRLSKDQTEIRYNDFLTLRGVPQACFDYRLGNRSALHWVLDQYQVKTDKRSGITNDPNRLDDEEYILRLIGCIITVSLKTVEIVEGLPASRR